MNSFSSGIHVSLSLVDVTKKSPISAYTVLKASQMFSDYPKNGISELQW